MIRKEIPQMFNGPTFARMRHTGAVAALVLVAACGGGGGGETTPTPEPNPNPSNPNPGGTGSLLMDSSGGQGPSRLDIATGRATALPKSALAATCTSCTDTWTINGAATSSDLLRIDDNWKLSFIDRRSLAETGALDTKQIAGTDRPDFYGPIRLSADGRYLLGYWKPNYRADDPQITVIDRQGRVIEAGSELAYSRLQATSAFDWLPNGDYVYLAGSKVVVKRPGAAVQSVLDLTLPANVVSDGANLEASPDGQRILLTLATRYGDTTFGVLYTIKLDGSDARQITQPSTRAQQAGVAITHAGASWSPDGRSIAFAVRGRNPGVPNGYQPCQPVLVIPATSQMLAVDGISDPDAWKLKSYDAAGQLRPADDCGGVKLGWF